MPIEVTSEAVEVLRRSLALAPHAAGVRLVAATGLGGGVSVQVELADGPNDGEERLEQEGVSIFIDPSLTEAIPDAIVAVEPQHERIVVRPRT